MLRVAFDATPLLGEPTGVGTFVSGAFGAMAGRADVALSGYALSWRGRNQLRAVLPPPVRACQGAMPASVLLRLWSWSGHPVVEAWTGPVDVVHGTNFVVPPSRRAAEVVTVHDLTAVHHPELVTAASRRYPRLIRRALARGAWVHTPSSFVASEVTALLGADPNRVRAVHHGITPLPTEGAPPPDVGGPYLLAVGTIEPRKDFPTLVRAFDAMAARHPDVSLVVAGPDGWGADAFRQAVAASRHRTRVVRLGYVDDAARASLLAHARAFVYPSLYEGFGLPPLEAMAAGVPVVATSGGAVPEVLGDSAVMVPPGDADALAGALAVVLDDDARRGELIRRGRARARGFDWDRCAVSLVELYRDAAAAGR